MDTGLVRLCGARADARTDRCAGPRIAVPAGVRGEVTHLLVTMALGATREETHP